MRRIIFGKVSNLRLRNIWRGLAIPFLFLSALIISPIPASAVQSMNLGWIPSVGTNVAGYTVYYGGVSGTYTNQLFLSSVTNTTVPGLREGAIYFFAACAWDGSGLEGDLSGEVSYAVPTNPPPALDPPANVTINENSGAQTISLSGISSGVSNQPVTVTATSSNPALVPNPTVSYTNPNTTGTLSFAPSANVFGVITITVTVNNGELQNNTVSRSFSITINQFNVPPTLNPLADSTISENAGLQTVLLSGITSGATNEPQSLTVTATSDNPSLIPNPSITYSSPNATGSLSFTPATNAFGLATITVSVNDGQPQSNLVSRTFSVTVHQPPFISPIGNQITAQNVPTPPIQFTISDAQTPASNLTLSASSSNPFLVANTNIVFGGSDGNRTITLIPSSGQLGDSQITINVSDGTAVSTATFKFSVFTAVLKGGPKLTVLVKGNGKISPDIASQTLVIGKALTLSATASAGYEFVGWSGNTNWSGPNISFLLASNLTFEADFIPSPFLPICGAYNGLFYEDDQIRTNSAGAFSFLVGPHGAYSGKLQIGASRYPFSGRLDLQCLATNLILRPTAENLRLQLRLHDGDLTNQPLGSVSDSSWIASLWGHRAVFNATTNPAPYPASFTLLVPGWDGDPLLPAGDGFGTVKVSAGGLARLTGFLPDGSRLTQSSPLSREGLWPLYAVLPGQGLAVSWLAITNRGDDDLNGRMCWIKPVNSLARYYPAGFTNQCDIIGSVYGPPISATNHILDLTNATVTFSGGNLPGDITNLVVLGLSSHVTNLSSNRLTLSFSLPNGTFSGAVVEPQTGRSFPLKGAVLQKLNTGGGFLTGTNQTSRVTVTP